MCLEFKKKECSKTEKKKCQSDSEMTESQQPLLLSLHFVWFLNKRLEVAQARNRVCPAQP